MSYLDDNDFSDAPSIPEFYKGKTIFITGGSGFMGKVLIEKLLYSCTDLQRIYLLLRAKKGNKPENRIASIFSSRCFDRLREERPGVFEKKVSVVSGDVSEIGLGLSEDDRKLLTATTNIVFHVAASVRFDDSLTYATKMNLRGTREMVDLAKDMKQLAAFVHVSTSYSNSNVSTIEEKMYPPHADWRDTINICETIDENIVNILTPKYLGNIPNTYTFTKQLAEAVVYEQRGILPVVMVRPSIVINSFEEPLPGWIDNFNGPVGILIACGKGIMRSVYSDPELICDYIPVDAAMRNIISVGWIRGVKKLKKDDDMAIFNCCAGSLKTITLAELLVNGKVIMEEMPFQNALWTMPGDGIVTKHKSEHFIKVLVLHLIPAIFADTILYAFGKKPRLIKLQRKIYIANLALGYFMTREWTFVNNNFQRLREIIQKTDSPTFNYYIEHIDKFVFFKNATAGSRLYLLNEKDEDLPKARVHFKRMYYLDKFVNFLIIGYILWSLSHSKFLMSTSQTLSKLMF